jgi:hypothetical protein
MVKSRGRGAVPNVKNERALSPLRSIKVERNNIEARGRGLATPKPWSLEITAQPNSIFYKDEGGKANHLWGVMRVVRKDNTVASFDAAEFKQLKSLFNFVLCFESKKVVEDGAEIFSTRDVVPQPLKPDEWTNGKVSEFMFKFRIDKVSRRKDGQHFSVRCELNKHESILDGADVNFCYTTPINVLSKRKSRSLNGTTGRPRSNSLNSNSSSRSNSKKRSRKDLVKLDAVLRRLDKVEADVATLKRRNTALKEALKKHVRLSAKRSKSNAYALLHDHNIDVNFDDTAVGDSFEAKCAKVYSPEGPVGLSFSQNSASADEVSFMSPLNAVGKMPSSTENLSLMGARQSSSDMPTLKRGNSLESVSSLPWTSSFAKLDTLVLP